MKPDWDRLGENFAKSDTVVIADVDCTIEKDLCSQYGVQGYPTIKYFTGSTDASGDAYNGGRTYDELKKWADENLGPSCGFNNKDLCDADQLKAIEDAEALSDDDLQAQIAAADKAIKDADTNFKDEVSKLQKQYEDLVAAKDAEIAKHTPTLRVLRGVQSGKKKAAAKHDEL